MNKFSMGVLLTLSLSSIAYAQGTTSTSEEPQSITAAGKVKFNMLMQAWALTDTMETSATGVGQLNFRIRRAELKFSGDIDENVRWFVMVDPAKSMTVPTAATNNNKVLQDFGIAYSFVKPLEITIGQFKVPTTAEGLRSSADLLLPERSIVGRTWGDKRQPGAMLTFKHEMITAQAMAANGQKPNVDDNNASKDLAFRVEAKPIDDLKVGAFDYLSDGRAKSATSATLQSSMGANISYSPNDLYLGAEGVLGESEDASGNSIKSQGLMGDVAYKVTTELQPVFRYETYTPNTDSGLTSSAYTLGVNYYLKKNNAKVQLAGTVYHNMTGNNGTTAASTTTRDGTAVTLGFQASL